MYEVNGRLFWFIKIKTRVPTVSEALFLWMSMVVSDLAPVGVGVYILGQWLGGQL